MWAMGARPDIQPRSCCEREGENIEKQGRKQKGGIRRENGVVCLLAYFVLFIN